MAPCYIYFFWDAGQVGPRPIVSLLMAKAPGAMLAEKGKVIVIRNRALGNITGTLMLLCIFTGPELVCLQGQTASASDPRIKTALNQVSVLHIQSDIEKLVSFQTRSTISAQDAASIAAGRGIGAAREWIKSEFERYSRDCGGCLEVKTDSFTQTESDRAPSPVEIA